MSTDSGQGHVLADPSQFEQVVMNLAVNARDAMPGVLYSLGEELRLGLAGRRAAGERIG